MAESSKSGGLGKQLFGAKNEPGRESKRKRKRGKKPARTQSKENLESELKGQECSALVCDEQNAGANNEDSKINTEKISPTDAANDEGETANVLEEVDSKDNDKMATAEIEQGNKTNETCMDKDGQQELETIQEQRSEEQGLKSEPAKPNQGSSRKKRKLSLRRSKKLKLSKSKSSLNEDKRDESQTGEDAALNTKTVEENAKETCEQQEDKADAAKFDESAGPPDDESNDASKSPEGIQEKSLSKSNKGKKLKQLASFGRNKKKPEIAVKLEETSNETNESLDDSPTRSERSESTRSQDSPNTEIVDCVSKEPVAADKSDFNNEHMNDGKDEGTEIEKKEAVKEKKKKGSVLGFKRSKSNLGKRKSSKNEDQGAENSPSEKTSARKESDDVSTMERDVEKKMEDKFEESNSEPKKKHQARPLRI
ncbi:hypothetical protein ACROYT_G009785 [Oculina patagonica]